MTSLTGRAANFKLPAARSWTPRDLTPDVRAKLQPEEREAIDKYRARHADLAVRWDSRQISPRALRIELVNFYADLGRRQLNGRFFGGEK